MAAASVGVALCFSKSPFSASCVTVILFSVSVPVLSLQITVALPKVSTEGSLRISAFCFAIRCTPSAMTMVAVAGSPSGMMEIASDTAIKNCGTSGRP